MKITVLKYPKKFIQKLSKKDQQRITTAILKIPEGDITPFRSRDSAYRLRVGDWRIVYDMIGNYDEIIIREIGNRGDVYK